MPSEPAAPTRKRVCVIVPCYNEARRLDVGRYRSYLENSDHVRILFVDDGSTDNTIQVVETVCAGLEQKSAVFKCARNSGKAEAVRVGINHALTNFEQEIVGYWDADLATPLESIDKFLSVLDNRPVIAMVFGSRVKLLGREVQRRAVRHYLGRIFATVVSAILRLPIYDTQCGAKLFRVTPQTREVFRDPFLSKWVFDVEIIARYLNLYRRDFALLENVIYEYPLEQWVDVAGSKVRPYDFLVAFGDVARIKLKYLR